MEPRPEFEKKKDTGLHIFNKEIELKNEKVVLPGMFIEQMTLYHGSATAGITSLTEAEDTTIGNGVYLTSQKEAATGYARVRNIPSHLNRNPIPVVYEIDIKNLNIANLSTPDSLEVFTKIFYEGLGDWVEKIDDATFKSEFHKILMREKAQEIRNNIIHGKFRHLKDLTFSFGNVTRNLLNSQGFDGLMAYEGGESINGFSIGDHDSFVIFDPSKTRIKKEEIIRDPLPSRDNP